MRGRAAEAGPRGIEHLVVARGGRGVGREVLAAGLALDDRPRDRPWPAGAGDQRGALAGGDQTGQRALGRARSGRRKAERELKSLLAARARAAVSNVGPGGPWAIPWAIVQCESGGQNLPPNSAGASGYYQFMPATWRALGGSTPEAYQASKEEQDRLAAILWAGGAGARNWVCAGLV